MSADIEARLRRLEDLEEIRRLSMDYRRHLDAHDLASYGALFADGGEWLGGTGHGRGPSGIRTMLEERLAANPPAPGATRFHLVSDPAIDVDGDRATGEVTWALVTRGAGDRPVLTLLGHYRDAYVRERGRWRFQRREAHTDIPHRPLAGAAAAGAAAAAAAAQPGDGAVEARLRRLEDLEAIRRLFAEYRRALDEKDFDEYCRLFTEDGVFVANGRAYEGREAIHAMLLGMLGGDLGARRGDDLHVVANPVVDLDGDRATAQLTWAYVVRGEDDRPVLRMLGRYDDVLRRGDGRWRFERRDARSDIPAV